MKNKNTTPVMKQFWDAKKAHPDSIMLFRMGDFYETFHDDAIKASKILGIVLTKRGAGSNSETKLAGFPHHALDTYLPKLVRAGQRVAICDQLENPKDVKVAYQESLYAYQKIINEYSSNAIRDIIKQMNNNNSFNKAFKDILDIELSDHYEFFSSEYNEEIKQIKLIIKVLLIKCLIFIKG